MKEERITVVAWVVGLMAVLYVAMRMKTAQVQTGTVATAITGSNGTVDSTPVNSAAVASQVKFVPSDPAAQLASHQAAVTGYLFTTRSQYGNTGMVHALPAVHSLGAK